MPPGERDVYEKQHREMCETKGVAWVRAYLASAGDENSIKRRDCRLWLAEWEAETAERDATERSEREARMEAANTESLRIARSAKNAAWAAAIAAVVAIVVAVVIPFVFKGT